MTKLKTGLIGCGKFANKHLANIVSLPDKFEMVAFCDVVKENAGLFNENIPVVKHKNIMIFMICSSGHPDWMLC
jgi:predicted dehydrogenase